MTPASLASSMSIHRRTLETALSLAKKVNVNVMAASARTRVSVTVELFGHARLVCGQKEIALPNYPSEA